MTDGPRARAWLGWALLVIPLWIVLVLCTWWEPVMRDGWGHMVWLRNHPGGDRGLADFVRECYLLENPRLGQIATMLAYLPGPYHAIVTPLVELAAFALLTALALGRWPRLGSTRDLLAAVLVTAIIAACTPQIGPMLAYRPFTWNYLFGLALNLAWLLPYRFALARPRPSRIWLAPALLVLGVAAGLCNEHTGIAFAAMAALATVVAWRRGGLQLWMLAGLAGLLAGYAVLLTAPAQHLRYGALAQQAGVVERIALRGLAGNLGVIGGLALALLPALPLVAIGLGQHRSAPASGATPPVTDRGSHAVLALAGVLCTLTLFASPKLGPRLYSASVALIAAGLAGWLLERLARPSSRRAGTIAAAGLSAGALVYVAVQLIAIHAAVGPVGAVRTDRIVHSHPGMTVAVPRFPAGVSRYFLGDDLVVPAARDLLAREYGLVDITLETER